MKRNNSKHIDSQTIEESNELQLDFSKLQKICQLKTKEILPVIVQHAENKEVLMLAYITPDALKKSIELKKAVFYSTTRDELWIKGESSKNYLEIKEIRVNCEQNSILFLVIPVNKGVCHTKNERNEHRKSCFYRKMEEFQLTFLEK